MLLIEKYSSSNEDDSDFGQYENLIAQVYNKRGKVVKRIYYESNEYSGSDSSDTDIDAELDRNPKECPFCGRRFSNKFNTKRHIYNTCKEFEFYTRTELPKTESRDITLSRGEYIKCQFPNTTIRDILYVAGPQRSGKSTYVKKYIEEFQTIFPDKTIFLLSRVDYDQSLKNDEIKNLVEIDIKDPEIIDDPIDVKEELMNSLIVFDDYTSLDGKMAKSVNLTLRDVIQNGADHENSDLPANERNDAYCAITSHQITDRNRTREILVEMSTLTIFPGAGDFYHIESVLREYFGLKKKMIDKIIGLKSRWITISKRIPRFVLYERGAFLL